MIKKFNSIFVTMFSLGRIGFLPGTFGSLATVIFLFVCFHILNISSNIILIILVILAIEASGHGIFASLFRFLNSLN